MSKPALAGQRGIEDSAFAPSWVRDAVFYQIFPDRFANGDPTNDPVKTESWGGNPTRSNFFGGDLQGIIQRMDYITGLGINAIYLNPIFESSSNHKYNTRDYRKIDPQFGDEELFRKFVDVCHARGVRVILDGVFNHTGTDFFAFRDLREKGASSKYVRWYDVHSFPVGPPNKPNYACWWGHGSLPKLMTQNPEVRNYLFDVTRLWMQFGIDGWRLDVPNEIPHPFWIEWRKLVKAINPQAYIVGEIWDDATPWLLGDQFDGVMNYRFREACVDFFARRRISVSRFDSLLRRQRADYPASVNYSLLNLLGSHDTERFLTLCKSDTAAVKLALLFQMTYPGAPMVYYGDEIGLQGGKDPECRRTMIWDIGRQDTSLLSSYKKAIKMRNDHAVLRTGTFETVFTNDSTRVYAFRRLLGGHTAIVAMNGDASDHQVTVRLSTDEASLPWMQVWPRDERTVRSSGGKIQISLPAMSAKVFIGGR